MSEVRHAVGRCASLCMLSVCVDCKMAALEERLTEREATISDLSQKIHMATECVKELEDKSREVTLLQQEVCVCVCVCVCACVCACVRACVRACVCVVYRGMSKFI